MWVTIIVTLLLFLFRPWLTLFQWQRKQKIVSTCTSGEVKRESQEKVQQEENWSQDVKEATVDYPPLSAASLYGIILYTVLSHNYICLWSPGCFRFDLKSASHTIHKGHILVNWFVRLFTPHQCLLNCTSTWISEKTKTMSKEWSLNIHDPEWQKSPLSFSKLRNDSTVIYCKKWWIKITF